MQYSVSHVRCIQSPKHATTVVVVQLAAHKRVAKKAQPDSYVQAKSGKMNLLGTAALILKLFRDQKALKKNKYFSVFSQMFSIIFRILLASSDFLIFAAYFLV